MHVRGRTINKAAAVLVAAGLAVTACAPTESAPGSTGADGLTTLKIMAPTFADAPAKDGELHKKIEEFTGTSMEISWTPQSDYEQRLNVTLAGADLPHLMVIPTKSPIFVEAAQVGAFWDLTDVLDSGKYSNLKTYSDQVRHNSSINGRLYGLYRWREPMRASVIIRRDWLDAVGMSAPKSMAELQEVARAFATKDPDGNGQADTFGLSATPEDETFFPQIEVWFGAPNAWEISGEGPRPAFESERWWEAQRYMREWFSEGLVNRDFATADGNAMLDHFKSGRAGILIGPSSAGNAVAASLGDGDAAAGYEKLLLIGTLDGPDGRKHPYPTAGYAGFIAIPKQSVPTEVDLEKVLSWLDKVSSKEGQVLFNNGIEGVNFELLDGAALYKEDQQLITQNARQSFAQLGTNNNGLLAYKEVPKSDAEASYAEVRNSLIEELPDAVVDPALPYIAPTYVSRGAQLDQTLRDAKVKFMVGQLDEQQLRAEVEQWKSSGGDEIAKELSELMKG